MSRKHPHRVNAMHFKRDMMHDSCGPCMRAARMAKTDSIVDDVDSVTRTVVDKQGSEHTATVTRSTNDN